MRDVTERLKKLMLEENARIGEERRPRRLVLTVRGKGKEGKSSYSVKRRSKSRSWPTGDIWAAGKAHHVAK